MSTVERKNNAGGFKPCADCTCSRGLLYRQRQRSLLLKQLKRRSGMFSGPGALSPLGSEEELHLRSNSLSSTGSTTSLDTYSVSGSILNECATRNVNTSKRLLSLRKEMVKHDLTCYIIPNEDEHNSEYVSLADERRAFISGFSGSAGVAVVTRDLLNFNTDAPEGKSLLSTDGRYFTQATQELDSNWSLNRQGIDKMTWQEWCIQECIDMWESLGEDPKKIIKIGVDPKLFTFLQKLEFDSVIREQYGLQDNIQLISIEENLVDSIWGQFENEPSRVLQPISYLGNEFSGESFESKRARLIECFVNEGKSAKSMYKRRTKGSTSSPIVSSTTASESSFFFVVSALDEICWLLNLRGSDIIYNPVFFSYLIIDGDKTVLFLDNEISSEGIVNYLKENKIEVRKYKDFWNYLDSDSTDSDKNYIISSNLSWSIVKKLKQRETREMNKTGAKTTRPANGKHIGDSPILLMKSIKNTIELNNSKKAQVKDGVALVQYFAWLENELVKKGSLIDEYKACEKLLKIKQSLENFQKLSFETISATGSNSAIIHYSPPQEQSCLIDPSKIYLCDSGSQFLEGTTDITRTVHFTKPTKEQIENYTLVLKGNLALERLQFPGKITNGYQIDILARQYLWENGLDYSHGTGHGVGSFLNVHEGPIGIGMCNENLIKYPLQHGQIVTNEPGFYKSGEYGLRIENDLMCVSHETHAGFLKFENMTMVPYCKKLINVKMLTSCEKLQINTYHKRVWETIVPFIQPQSISYKWLKRECSAV